MPLAARAATAESPIAPAPDHNGNLARSYPRATNVELSDRERINQGNGVVRYPIADGTGHGLGDDEELAKTALGFGVLADHLGAGQAAIHEEDGHRRDPGATGN